jgi:L-histidine N-alpha-methyltransferase
VLCVLDRQLGADFDPDAFDHVARYLPEQEQVEMALEARHPMAVSIPALGLAIELSAGERIRTEISRKFTRDSAAAMIEGAGLALDGWYTDAEESFALVTATRG